MTAKTTLLALLLTGFGLLAQSQPAPAPNAETNRDELLRQALRQAIEAKTNPATAGPVPAAALSVPLPTPPLRAAPVAPAGTAPPDQAAPAAPADSAAAATERPAPPGAPPAEQPAPTDASPAATNRISLPKDPAAVQLAPADSSLAATNRIAPPGNPAGGPPAPATRIAAPSSPVGTSVGPPGPAAIPGNPAASGAPAPGPGAPAVAGKPQPTDAGPPATTNAPAGEDVIPPGTINFRAVDMNDVLTLYAEYVGRTLLRPTSLPAVVITLKTQTPLTKPEVIQALEAVLALNGISIIPVGEKFAKVVPSQSANQAGAALHEEKAKELPELGSYVTHVVQLKYVKPSELMTVLTPFASQIPNPILPIDGSQMLVLRDYTENVKRMLEMIEKIDVAVPAEFVSEVIPIKYALASDISAALNALSAGGGGTTVGAGAGGGAGATRGGIGGRTGTGFGGGQRSLGGTGAGLGGAYPGTYGTPGIGQQGTQTGVGTTPGTGGTFSDRLRSIIQRAGGGGAGEIQVIGTTKIIADERTNSLLIFASRTDMETIKKIISQLDVVLAQVLIETVIIEYTLGPDTRNVGFSYVQSPRNLAGNIAGEGAGGAGQFLNRGFTAISGGTNSSGGLTGGFNYLLSFGQDLDVTVSAIEASSKGKVLQRPRIQTSHAVPAQIFVGESRPYPQGSYYGGGSFGGYSTIQQLQIGVTLEVTPLINPDGLVVMDIHQTIENYAGFTDITGVGQVPITTRKEASAKVVVRDRDTIMLGGLIETNKSKSHSGVPFLMDIPLLGYLFRSTSTSDTRKELIVLIRPSVLPTPEVAALTARSEKEKMAGVRETEREIMEENAARLRDADKHLK